MIIEATKNIEPLLASDSLIETILLDHAHIPVAFLKDEIRRMIMASQNFVLVGETGSGKTTLLPLLLLELKEKLGLKGGIAVTQPRRLAAKNVTSYTSEMFDSQVGDKIGYRVRFENITSDNTDITYMTDGLLLREAQFDPMLLNYSIIMVDEAHERGTNIDLCLMLLLEVNKRRTEAQIEPIRIVIASATIERNRFAEYIATDDTDNSLEIPGKMFPVEVFYETEESWNPDFTQAAADKVAEILKKDLPGDILIFMPGKPEISQTIEKIEAKIGTNRACILPLHAELSPEDQDVIFLTSNKRKIIVSTNIAETSVTIDGIIHVIDSGYIKQTEFDPITGIERLVLTEHAISGLEQRKGRAGRTAAGFCHRLFTKESLKKRPQYQTPEIQRSNLIQLALVLKIVGIRDIRSVKFLDFPHKESLYYADEMLSLLGATDKKGELTRVGYLIHELGIEPQLARMVIEAAKVNLDCVSDIVTIASFLDGKNIFIRPTDTDEARMVDHLHEHFKVDAESDFIVLLNVWKEYVKHNYDSEWAKKYYLNEKSLEEAKNVRLELLKILEKHDIFIDQDALPAINKNAIGKALAAGLIGNLMRYTGKKSLSKIDGRKGDISIHPGSVIYGKKLSEGTLVIASEIFTNPKGNTYACNCLEVKKEWLKDLLPNSSLPQEKTTFSKNRSKKSHQTGHFSRHRSNRR